MLMGSVSFLCYPQAKNTELGKYKRFIGETFYLPSKDDYFSGNNNVFYCDTKSKIENVPGSYYIYRPKLYRDALASSEKGVYPESEVYDKEYILIDVLDCNSKEYKRHHKSIPVYDDRKWKKRNESSPSNNPYFKFRDPRSGDIIYSEYPSYFMLSKTKEKLLREMPDLKIKLKSISVKNTERLYSTPQINGFYPSSEFKERLAEKKKNDKLRAEKAIKDSLERQARANIRPENIRRFTHMVDSLKEVLTAKFSKDEIIYMNTEWTSNGYITSIEATYELEKIYYAQWDKKLEEINKPENEFKHLGWVGVNEFNVVLRNKSTGKVLDNEYKYISSLVEKIDTGFVVYNGELIAHSYRSTGYTFKSIFLRNQELSRIGRNKRKQESDANKKAEYDKLVHEFGEVNAKVILKGDIKLGLSKPIVEKILNRNGYILTLFKSDYNSRIYKTSSLLFSDVGYFEFVNGKLVRTVVP